MKELFSITLFLCIWASGNRCDYKPGPYTPHLQVSHHNAVPKAKHPDKTTPQIPVLCYHQVRDWTASDSRSSRTYIVRYQHFRKQIKMLNDSGYHVISTDELADHLLRGANLPEKPVVLTFDDGTVSQYINALPELDHYGFKATFFIMTVTLDRPGYLSRDQIKELAKRGHTIGCHTWDHHDVRRYKDPDWIKQVTKPTRQLEQITGQQIHHFAYPFGTWNSAAIRPLKENGYVSAYQLNGKQDPAEPMYSIRRILVDGNWTTSQLNQALKNSFQ